MTTARQMEYTCATCGEPSTHMTMASTNQFGSPDLDLRPPPMQRSTMSMWMQQCPDCGYCAPTIADRNPDARDAMANAQYRSLLVSERWPDLARRFLLHALISERKDRRVSSQARLHAAWVCDDEGLAELACECRSMAAHDLKIARPFAPSEAGLTQGAIYVDVLRRAGRFDDAAEAATELLVLPH